MLNNKTNYKDLTKYAFDNELHIYNESLYLSILNDTFNKEVLLFIEDHLNDEEILHDLPTGVIKDMFVYYTKHHK